MGQVGQEQGSSSSGQQLLPATAPNMEQATEAAPNIISQLLLQDKKEELLEHPILANTDSSPAAENTHKQTMAESRLKDDQVHSSDVEKVMQLPMGQYAPMSTYVHLAR